MVKFLGTEPGRDDQSNESIEMLNELCQLWVEVKKEHEDGLKNDTQNANSDYLNQIEFTEKRQEALERV